MRGIIVEIEGTDGSGKKTQIGMLYDRMQKQGKAIIKTDFPRYESESSGPVKMYLGGELCENAKEINAYQASTLYAVDRFCTYKSYLEKVYKDGSTILMDRYVGASMMHQAGKIGDAVKRDEFLDWLDNLEFGLFELPRPDVVIFLDMPVEYNLKLMRGNKLKTGKQKDIHEQDSQHLQEAYDAGKYVAKKYSWNTVSCIDKNGNIRTIEDIHEEVYKIVQEVLLSEDTLKQQSTLTRIKNIVPKLAHLNNTEVNYLENK